MLDSKQRMTEANDKVFLEGGCMIIKIKYDNKFLEISGYDIYYK